MDIDNGSGSRTSHPALAESTKNNPPLSTYTSLSAAVAQNVFSEFHLLNRFVFVVAYYGDHAFDGYHPTADLDHHVCKQCRVSCKENRIGK